MQTLESQYLYSAHKEPLQLDLVVKLWKSWKYYNKISEYYETMIDLFNFMKCQVFFISGFKSEC